MKLSERDRRALMLLGIAAAALVLYGLFTRGSAKNPTVVGSDSTTLAERRLERLRQLAAMVPSREQAYKQNLQDLSLREKTLIAADSAELAQEKLLEIVHKLAKAPGSSIDIRRQELGQPRPYADYGQVSLTISTACRIDQLVNFLADLTAQPESIGTEELHIGTINPDSKIMQVRMTISGLVPAKLISKKKGACRPVKKTLIVVNLLLVVLISTSVWLVVQRNRAATRAQSAILNRKFRVRTVAPPPSQKMTPAAAPQTYFNDAVQKLLFAKDRNPNVVEKPKVAPPEPPVPPMPAAYGLLTFGEPTLILSEKPGVPQRGYHRGDAVGSFKLVDFDAQHVVLEWNGKEIEKPMSELAANQATAAAPEPVQAPAATQAPEQSKPDSTKASPGADLGAGERACQAGDATPAGTVIDGYKKVITQSPFGVICRWIK